MWKSISESNIRRLFVVSLWLKGFFALSELIAGGALYFVSKDFLADIVDWVTRNEFAEDPHDFLANYLRHAVETLSLGTQNFAALYLASHGIIKLWLIVGLLQKRLWYYPTALVVFGLFIAYQLYRYTFTHSLWLLLVTALDIVVIALTWHEYRFLRRQRTSLT